MSYNDLLKGRTSIPNQIYCVTTIVNKRKQLFNDLQIARTVIKEMKMLHDSGYVESLTWVLMPDHLHWLLSLGNKDSLSTIVKLLKARSAISINKILKRSGSVWQKSFHDHALRKESNIKDFARYIVANPVRAGIVKSIWHYPFWDSIWI